jgi:hypothetical protein
LIHMSSISKSTKSNTETSARVLRNGQNKPGSGVSGARYRRDDNFGPDHRMARPALDRSHRRLNEFGGTFRIEEFGAYLRMDCGKTLPICEIVVSMKSTECC